MKEIPLTPSGVALVDDEDYETLIQWSWSLHRDGYAYRIARTGGKRRHVKMHRLIMGEPRGKHVDHRDGKRLNNQRYNLRASTPRQNQRNKPSRGGSSRYKGVTRVERRSSAGEIVVRWRARIQVGEKYISLGYHDTEEAAAAAYNRAARRYHKEFARLNDLSNGGKQLDGQIQASH